MGESTVSALTATESGENTALSGAVAVKPKKECDECGKADAENDA